MRSATPIIIDMDGSAVHVGEIRTEPNEGTRFVVADSYIDLGPTRPILSLAWHDMGGESQTIDRLRFSGDKIGSPRRLPDWFAGLLPEGALRELVESEMGSGNFGEIDVLHRLGQDLPGAVRVGEITKNTEVVEGRIRFSLSGVQLKFVGEVGSEGRITFPAAGLGGHYVVKTPSTKHPYFVEAEALALQLVQAVGVNVAETSLAPTSSVDGIPEQYLAGGDNVLVSQRFDRRGNRRIHAEDFAQIAQAVGDLKYTRASYGVVLRIASRFSTKPEIDAEEVVRRAVSDILVGNSDAHLKNWSFVFDGAERTLSPAYDILPYRAYGDRTLAAHVAEARDIDNIPMSRFVRFVRSPELLRIAQETAERALDTWPTLINNSPAGEVIGKVIVDRLEQLSFPRDLLALKMRGPDTGPSGP